MCRSLLLAVALILVSLPSAANDRSIEALETELIEVGESADLLYRLARAYADRNDVQTARLYLNYLEEGYPDFVEARSADIIQLKQDLVVLNAPRQQNGLVGLYQLATGVDSNATQGTAMSQLDLVLANGETLVLAVDPDSREVRSAFVGAKVAAVVPLTSEVSVRGMVEHVHYQESDVASATLTSVELMTPNHTLAGYAFDRYGSRAGIAYQGNYQSVFWGGQSDDDQERVFAGLQSGLPLGDSASGYWSAQVFRGDTVSQGHYKGTRWVAGFEVARVGVEYSFEQAEYEELFDAVFFPSVRDTYEWHRLDVALPVAIGSDQRIDVILGYNEKRHDVSLNSWRGLDARLVLSAPIQ